MLRIKKEADLKELEKFGFEVFGNSAKKTYWLNYMEDDTIFMIEHRDIWFIENGAKDSNERYFGNPQFDTLYDLIQAGLVEKIEEDK